MIPCLNRASLGNGSYEEFLDAASAAGFPGVDCGIEPLVEAAEKGGLSAAKEILEKRKLRLLAYGASAEWRKGDAELEASMPAFRKQAEMASKLGVTRCMTWVLSFADVPFDERWKQVVPKLKKMNDVLRDAGVRFALEFLGPKHIYAGKIEFIHTMREGLMLADAIGSGAGVMVDTFHWYTSGSTVEELRAMPDESIVHVHMNDAPDRPREEQKDGERLLPGDGIIDLKGFLGVLRQKRYDGPLAVEVFNADLKKLPLAEAAKKCQVALDKVMK
jgi:sugar phosphate isomerase/epimerase